jgi:hypothetical protein
VLLALIALARRFAQEGGAIRSGEHTGFSRVVMRSIRAPNGRSRRRRPGRILFFPGQSLDFGTAGVFETIPRTRVTVVRQHGPHRRHTGGGRPRLRLPGQHLVRRRALSRARRLPTAMRPSPQPAPLSARTPDADANEVEDAAARELREAAAVATAEASCSSDRSSAPPTRA